jgi:hypothetical protein
MTMTWLPMASSSAVSLKPMQRRSDRRGCGRWPFGHHKDRTPTHGYAETREAAMAAFAKSWRRQ